MDGAQEVERKHTVRAVSANVHTRARRCVSFGEPVENTGVRAVGAILGRLRWTTASADRFAAPARKYLVSSAYIFGKRRSRIGSRSTGQTVVELALLLPMLLMLMVGLIEIGRYAYFDILISNAARA